MERDLQGEAAPGPPEPLPVPDAGKSWSDEREENRRGNGGNRGNCTAQQHKETVRNRVKVKNKKKRSELE